MERTLAVAFRYRPFNPPDEFAEMQGLCLANVLPNLSTQNIAVSGSTSLQHLEMLKQRLEPQDEETLGIVVMTTAGNDLIHNYGRSAPKEGANVKRNLRRPSKRRIIRRRSEGKFFQRVEAGQNIIARNLLPAILLVTQDCQLERIKGFRQIVG